MTLPPSSSANLEAASEAWHSESVEDVAHKLATHLERGLTPDEAVQRLTAYGPNELQEAARPPFW